MSAKSVVISQETAKYLCENIQGCSLAYTQSDEISLLLIDYQRFKTSAWLDYEIQKMCSISASMATMAFNQLFVENYNKWGNGENSDYSANEDINEFVKLERAYCKALRVGAMFDARVFNIPKEETINYFYWRQLDASRNSIQMLGQANFSHKELQYKSCNDIQDMLMTQKGINWNDYPTCQKRGSCVVRNRIVLESDDEKEKCMLRDPKQGKNNWIIDYDIPIFKGDGKEYIERLLNVGEE